MGHCGNFEFEFIQASVSSENVPEVNKKLSYRKQITRKPRTQYV